MAAPVLVAEVMGGNAKATVSKEYGGSGTDPAAAKATPVYNAIGQVHSAIWRCGGGDGAHAVTFAGGV